MNKRDLFNELTNSLNEVKQHCEGKITLRSLGVSTLPQLEIAPYEIMDLRERLNISRSVFAHLLRTSPRTLENWEQGRSVPNGPALTLLKLVQQHPETLVKISSL